MGEELNEVAWITRKRRGGTDWTGVGGKETEERRENVCSCTGKPVPVPLVPPTINLSSSVDCHFFDLRHRRHCCQHAEVQHLGNALIDLCQICHIVKLFNLTRSIMSL